MANKENFNKTIYCQSADVWFDSFDDVNKHMRMNYKNKYAGGSNPINSIDDLRKTINDLCGEGSYLKYHKDNHAVVHPYQNGKLTYFQQGFKTDVIEKAREAAWLVWGYIPELEVGTFENSFKETI